MVNHHINLKRMVNQDFKQWQPPSKIGDFRKKLEFLNFWIFEAPLSKLHYSLIIEAASQYLSFDGTSLIDGASLIYAVSLSIEAGSLRHASSFESILWPHRAMNSIVDIKCVNSSQMGSTISHIWFLKQCLQLFSPLSTRASLTEKWFFPTSHTTQVN